MPRSKRMNSLNRRLWTLVRKHPGGEDALRDMVASIHSDDGTGKALVGTDAFTSTRQLTEKQFLRLIARVEAGVPRPTRRKNNDEGNVTFLATAGSTNYIRHLAGELGWTDEGLKKFIKRQTKGKGVRTYAEAQAVVVPLERMLRDRGYELLISNGRKWCVPPEKEVRDDNEEDARQAEADS